VPTFFARWPDGSFAIVAAEDETDAYVQLDEIADEPAEVWEMDRCLMDFGLNDNGTFTLTEVGGDTATEILSKGYPTLLKALLEEPSLEHAIVNGPISSPARSVRKAVTAERKRLRSAKTTPAKTAAGREVQKRMNCSGPYADAIVASVVAGQAKAKKVPPKRKKPVN
jgi:hypothetical protein